MLEKDLLRRFSAEWLGRRAKQKRLLLLQELPDAGGSQQRSAAIRSSLFLCPSLLHASLGATFTCLSVAQFLPPREALACISHQFPCKAVSPSRSYYGTCIIGSALALCCVLGHRTSIQIPPPLLA